VLLAVLVFTILVCATNSFVLGSIFFILLLLLFSSGTFSMYLTLIILFLFLVYLLNHK